MKYYKIQIQRYFEDDRIASNANGGKVCNAKFYFNEMKEGIILEKAPVFDYFYLESYDDKKYWEWKLFDVYKFIGEGSQISGWFISQDLKLLLEGFKLALPHHYYTSKLLYRGNKLDYYIFQFFNKNIRNVYSEYLNFSKCVFFNPNDEIIFSVNNEKELLNEQENILINSEYNVINIPIKKLVVRSNIDFLPLQNFFGNHLVSERLKQAIEKMGIEGFEFSELDYEVVING